MDPPTRVGLPPTRWAYPLLVKKNPVYFISYSHRHMIHIWCFL